MNRLAFTALVLCCGFQAVAAAQEPKSDPALTAELDHFRGTWKITSLLMAGQEIDAKVFEGTLLKLDGDKFEMTDPMATYKGTFKIDPKAKPKTIDIHFSDGPEAGKTVIGVYELEGDTYRVCLDMADKGTRPAALKSTSEDGYALETLERVKP